MSTELWMLALTGILAVCQMALQSFIFKAQVGNAYTVGPRDEAITPVAMAGRADRAYRNLLEMLPVFVIAVVIVEHTGAHDFWTALGAQIFFWGRVAFVPAYLTGWPWVRTLTWNASMIGLALIYWRILV
ncbi:MAG: MAPEG family protein [Hyphomicrobiales bacterium]